LQFWEGMWQQPYNPQDYDVDVAMRLLVQELNRDSGGADASKGARRHDVGDPDHDTLGQFQCIS
jgi:hypothetical protein